MEIPEPGTEDFLVWLDNERAKHAANGCKVMVNTIAKCTCNDPKEIIRCAKCRIPEEDTDYGILMDIKVVTRDGEEGFSAVKNLYCDDCFTQITTALTDLGFKSHRHGTTSSLEDLDCIGAKEYGKCPTPTDEIEWEL